MKPKESAASIDDSSVRFKKHISEKDNDRILFSGKYGIGKSYFLKEFFSKRKEYNTFLISPVNYVVSSNEDIFDLIKVDLTLQLFEKGIIEKESPTKISDANKIQWFAKENPLHIFKFLSTAIKKIKAGPLEIDTDFIKALLELSTEYDKYKKKLEERFQVDKDTFEKFLNSFSESSGSIYESNFLTQLINQKLEAAKQSKKQSENVLIIDDLDRLDPEHIFRILNILSVHNNYFGEKHKFAFDKIIVVCDIENIKKIYAHKYGTDVDFEGYIDKFYSSQIFTYSNRDSVELYIKEANFKLGENDTVILKYLLIAFLDASILTMRKLIKYRQDSIVPDVLLVESKFDLAPVLGNRHFSGTSFINPGSNLKLLSSDISFLQVINICIKIFGSYSSLMQALQKFENKPFINIPEEDKKIAGKGLAFPFHILQNIMGNKNLLFYQLRANYNNSNVDEMAIPSTTFASHIYNFKVIWNNSTKYSNESPKSYFYNMVIDQMPTNSRDNLNFIRLIQDIITTLYKERILFKAQVTTE